MPDADQMPVADQRLLDAGDRALAALREVTPAASIGEPIGYVVEADGVVSLHFATTLPGYPGWHWTVSLAVVDGADPTVLEVELLPGDDALLAPEWVPWAVRLQEFKTAQAAAESEAVAGLDEDDDPAGAFSDDEDDDDLDDEDDFDDEDDEGEDLDEQSFDADGSPLLHSGDLDGVDIDELDEDPDATDDDGPRLS